MAWYRAGGGGIPAALKTGMNDVLNKKFGTSTTYAPNTWPDNVNLLGKLPEKTVSGASAHLTDGADRVPVKNWQVTVDASLTGYSSVDVVQTGKNILPNTAQTATDGNVTFTVNSDGSVSLSGIASTEVNFYIYSGFAFPKTGTYKLTGCPLGGSTNTYRIFVTNYGADTGSGLTINVTNTTTTASIRINIKSGVDTSGLVFKPQIEVGSTATEYAPYVAPTVSTVSLGRTIYGGSVDVVNGTGTENYVRIDLGSLTWSNNASYANVFNGALPTGYVGDTTTDFICEDYANANSTSVITTDMSIAFNYGRTVLYCHDNRFSDWSDFKQAVQGKYIVYKCTAKAEDFTFTPITPTPETALGVNNFWADANSTSEVTYRRDIDLALA